MKRVIYSLYIDVPKEELDVFDKNILKPNVVPTNYKTKSEFKKNSSVVFSFHSPLLIAT